MRLERLEGGIRMKPDSFELAPFPKLSKGHKLALCNVSSLSGLPSFSSVHCSMLIPRTGK